MTVPVVLGYDATHLNIGSLPKGQAAGYVTGSPDITWTEADWNAHPRAVRIDQSPVNSPLDETADVLDYENGAATISDIVPWVKAALANYRSGARPGQRYPAIYASRNNLTAVANALAAGGVKGTGLWVADWTGNEGAASAEVANGNGPYPVIGVQYANAGGYDRDVFSVPWLTSVSGPPSPPAVTVQAPPGQWNNAEAWTWAEAVTAGIGLDGKMHLFTLDISSGKWVQAL